MKHILFSISLLLFSFFAFAQKPEWTDYNEREKVYPTREYLVGYAQESNIKKNELQVSYDYIEQLARAELIESVQVLVNSVSSAETADYNGEISDFFDNKTVSSSSANLVGLKKEQYYDKKKKTTHILVYVKRREIIDYYVSLVKKNVSDIKQLLSQSKQSYDQKDYKVAFKNVYNTPSFFATINESQTYLLALGEKSAFNLRTQEVNELKSKVEAQILVLNNDSNKTLEDVGYFVSFALGKYAFTKKDSVKINAFTYQSTGLATKFSYVLKEKLKSDLGSNAALSLVQKDSSYANIQVKGTYWEKGDFILIKSALIDVKNNIVLKSFSSSVSKSSLKPSATYLSADILNIANIPNISLSTRNDKLTGQVGFPVKQRLEVKVVLKDAQGKSVVQYNVPVRFVDKEHNIDYGTAWTDKYGIARFKINRIKNGNRSQVIAAELDLDNFLKVSKDNDYLNEVLKKSEVPSVNFYATIKESLVYFLVNEKNMGQALGIPVIEPELKKYLTQAGYSFTQKKSEASLIIEIVSDTRKGGDFSGVYFSYLDITLSVKEKSTMKEIFKKSYNGYKGSGSNFNQAGSRSYEKAIDEVCPAFYDVLMNL